MTIKCNCVCYVANENTLCYRGNNWPESYLMYGVLAGSVLRGGKNPLDGGFPFNPAWDKMRLATKADFEFFRVHPAGFFEGESKCN